MKATATTSSTQRSVVTVPSVSDWKRRRNSKDDCHLSGRGRSRGCPALRNVQIVAMPHMGEPSFTKRAYSGHRPAFLDDVNAWSAP